MIVRVLALMFGAALLLATLSCVGSEQFVLASDIHVVDGDTIKYRNNRYRLKGFDTPETYQYECNYEKHLGETATHKLRQLLNEAEVIILHNTGARDKYNHSLAQLFVDGQNVGSILINNGFARPYYGGKRLSWCN